MWMAPGMALRKDRRQPLGGDQIRGLRLPRRRPRPSRRHGAGLHGPTLYSAPPAVDDFHPEAQQGARA